MFRTVLAELTRRTPGARWALIGGADGVPLETDPADIGQAAELLAAEYAGLFCDCLKVTARTAAGELQGAVLTTDRGRVVMQALTPDYFLLLGLGPQGHTGKALFEIARAREAIVEELAI